MKTTQQNGHAVGSVPAKTTPAKYKRFPAFGKRMMDQRMAGQVPPNSVVVAFEWDIGRIFPRIVIADAVPFEDIELRYLAGLDVMLTYRDKDASKVMELAQTILKVNPRSLLAFALDIPKNTILKNLAGEVMI
jgi:hypothetical protein